MYRQMQKASYLTTQYCRRLRRRDRGSQTPAVGARPTPRAEINKKFIAGDWRKMTLNFYVTYILHIDLRTCILNLQHMPTSMPGMGPKWFGGIEQVLVLPRQNKLHI